MASTETVREMLVLDGSPDLHRPAVIEDRRVGALGGVLFRIPLHPHVIRAAERRVRQVGELLIGGDEFQVGGETLGELLEEDLHLHAGQVLSQALVTAVPERQVIARVLAADVEVVGMVEVALVVVRGRRDDQQLRAFGNVDAADRGVGGDEAAPRGDRTSGAGTPRRHWGIRPGSSQISSHTLRFSSSRRKALADAFAVVSCAATIPAIIIECR